MPQETIVYIVNLIIGAILAGLMTHQWRVAGQAANMRLWMIAAWVMTIADAIFALRSGMPPWLGRFLPVLLVTVGHGILLLGSECTANRAGSRRLILYLLALHATALVGFIIFADLSKWRMVFNGLLWGGLSIASAWALRRSPPPFHRPLLSPANVFLVHGIFHAFRVVLGSLSAVKGWSTVSTSLQVVSDLEVSFFMVALFVSLLISHLQQRHEELSQALAEVRVLSGLLPVCAWCRKVRDDDGYWRQMEEYFLSHSQLKFTHGICNDCRQTHFPSKDPPAQ